MPSKHDGSISITFDTAFNSSKLTNPVVIKPPKLSYVPDPPHVVVDHVLSNSTQTVLYWIPGNQGSSSILNYKLTYQNQVIDNIL